MQTGYETMIHGGEVGVAGGGVRQIKLPQSDCRGIKNFDTVEKSKTVSGGGGLAVATQSSGT